jgi:agmatine deiminase
VVTNLSDIWIQDYGPLFTEQDRSHVAVIARYEPLGADHFPRKTCIDPLPQAARELARVLADAICDLDVALDWGNIVYHGQSNGRASIVMTKVVKKQNGLLGLRAIRAQLESAFGARIVFADCEEDDPVGHIDGSVRFVDADTVIIPKYPEDYRPGRRNKELLERHFVVHTIDGPESRLIPFCMGNKSLDYDAFGSYLNFIELPTAIVMPVFGVAHDQRAEAKLRNLFKKDVRTVNCDLLSASAGALHCISKSIPWEVEW